MGGRGREGGGGRVGGRGRWREFDNKYLYIIVPL